MIGSKPPRRAPPADLNTLVTLQISLVAEVPNERAQAALEELLATTAREFQMRLLLISNHIPIGETMMRYGLQDPVRKKLDAKA